MSLVEYPDEEHAAAILARHAAVLVPPSVSALHVMPACHAVDALSSESACRAAASQLHLF